MEQNTLMTDALKILGFAALTLSVKILTWLSMTGALSLFIYAMVEPQRERTIAAALFALLVFLPSLLMERKPRPPTQVPMQTPHIPHINNGSDSLEDRYA